MKADASICHHPRLVKALVVVLLLIGSARAEDLRVVRQLRSSIRSELPARAVDPHVAASVFDPTVRTHELRSIVEHRDLLPDPSRQPEKASGRRRVSLLPMGSMAKGTGSKGVKLKIRF